MTTSVRRRGNFFQTTTDVTLFLIQEVMVASIKSVRGKPLLNCLSFNMRGAQLQTLVTTKTLGMMKRAALWIAIALNLEIAFEWIGKTSATDEARSEREFIDWGF